MKLKLWIVIDRKRNGKIEPSLRTAQVPIFWKKSSAEDWAAKNFASRVIRCNIDFDEPVEESIK